MPEIEICKSCKNKLAVINDLCQFCFDREANKLIEKLKGKEPNWDLYQELGKMLIRNIKDLTPEELERYEELKSILAKNN